MLALIALSVVTSIISQSAQDLFVIIFTLFFLKELYQSTDKKSFFNRTGLEWVFIVFTFFTFAGLIIKYPTHTDYWLPAFKTKWILLFYMFLWAFKKFEFNSEKFNEIFIPLTLISSIYGILSYMHGYDYIHPEVPTHRVIGFVNSPTYHAHAGGIILAFSLPLFLLNKSLQKVTFKNILAWLSFAILLVSVYLTYTRGIHIALVLTILIGTFILNRKIFIASLVCILLGATIIYYQDPMLQKRVSETVVKERQDQGRIGLFKSHLQIFLDNPILGLGYDAYKNQELTEPYTSKNSVPQYLYNSHSHNQFLQMFSSMGVIGGICYIIIVFYFLIINIKTLLIKNLERNNYVLAMACLWAQIQILLSFCSDQTFEYAKIKTVIIAVWALTTALYLQQKAKIKAG